jgi:hypothetical protein
MIVLRKANARSTRLFFLLLTALIFLMLHFTFLQKASYAMVLAGSYCLYRTIVERDWRLSTVFAAACGVAIIGAFPRLYGIASAMREYSRITPGMHLDQFSDVYMFQAIFPSQILRWFDGGIFGRYPSEVNLALQNYLNFTEGFLLYTSSFVPFLLLFGILAYRDRPFALIYSRRNDGSFFFWFFAFTISVIVAPFVLKLIWLLYLRMDFTHARILIVGLLPLSAIVALILADLEPATQPPRGMDITLWLVALVSAVALVGVIEWIARSLPGNSILAPSFSTLHVSHEALARIAMSFIAIACLIVAIRGSSPRRLKESRVIHIAKYPKLAVTGYWTLGLAIGLQTFLGADFQINGSYTHTGLPFRNGNNYYSSKANFHPPTPDAVDALGQRLDNDNFRSVLLCDASIAGGFCAGHIPEFWRLRVIDGYYGLGVPARLAALPWHWSVGLRTISHTSLDKIDWPVLSLLNVKYIVTVDDALYRNNSAGPGEGWRPASPGDVKIEVNPLSPVPRYYFARKVVPVSDAAQAASKLFEGNKLVDVTEASFVENFASPQTYSDAGAVSARGTGDNIEITVEPTPTDRFLVANELYFPGWSAKVDGKQTTIYPTNAVMRGVVIPAGARTVEFFYTPFTRRNISLSFYGAALMLAGVGAFVFGRPPLRG